MFPLDGYWKLYDITARLAWPSFLEQLLSVKPLPPLGGWVFRRLGITTVKHINMVRGFSMQTGNDFAIWRLNSFFFSFGVYKHNSFRAAKTQGYLSIFLRLYALWILKNRRARYYTFNNLFGLLFMYYTVPSRTYIYSITQLFILSRGFAVFVRALFFYCTILRYFAFI